MPVMVANVPLTHPDHDDGLAAIAKRLGIDPQGIVEAVRVRRSLDARHGRQRWQGVFKVTLHDEPRVLAANKGLRIWAFKDDLRYGLVEEPPPPAIAWAPSERFVVVGAGPAGLFAALYLAECGASVVLVDRGGPVKDRVKAVNGFWRRKKPFHPENNVLFGEGGAGTFSDGKIYTRRRDEDIGYILRRFVDFGAKSEILEEGWAHLGTDKVRALLPIFRQRLQELGVEVRFHTRVDDVLAAGGRVQGVLLGDGEELPASVVIMAPGHSARDTVRTVARRGAEVVARPIAIGARIEHPQALINAGRYGRRMREGLPAASYRLALDADGLKARTFCMCPGGMVVPAMSQANQVVVNGMSFEAQGSFWANSAVIVEVDPKHYGGEDPLAGYAWQQAIEERAFQLAGEDFAAPSQRALDLVRNQLSTDLPKVSYPMGVRPVDLRQVVPELVWRGMIAAVQAWDKQLPGFLSDEAVFIAPETRTTSPVRFLRGDDFHSTTLRGLVPVGEGAGYGGGIVSCALDGLRAARALVQAKQLAK